MYFTRGICQGVGKTFISEALYIKFRAGLQLRDQSGGDSFIQNSERAGLQMRDPSGGDSFIHNSEV